MTGAEYTALLEQYLPKIFGFSVMKTNSRAEAEDLSQDIAYQILRTINAGKKIENFNAFVWCVSNRTFYNYLRRKKHVCIEYLSDSLVSENSMESDYILSEQMNDMRRELSRLSKRYRQTLVMFYFDGKSCEAIAAETGASVGTVKWWLHEGRKQIAKGMDNMRKYGEKSYKPGRLIVSCKGIPGLGGEPMCCVRSLAAQNILLAAYKTPMSIDELCGDLGISAAYIEDDVEYLRDNMLLCEVSAGRYQTDFVILSGNSADVAVKLYDACFPAYYDALITYLNKYRDELLAPENNIAAFTWKRLLWVYLHIVGDILLNKFKAEVCHTHCYDDIPDRPNGRRWIALGFDNSNRVGARAAGIELPEYVYFDGPVNRDLKEFAQDFFHFWSGLDSRLFFDLPSGVFELCRRIIKGELAPDKLSEEQKCLFSAAIENGLFVKRNDVFVPNYFFIGREGLRLIENMALGFYDTALPYFEAAWSMILDKYKSDIPKRLWPQSADFLSNHLSAFVTCSFYEAIKRGDISTECAKPEPWLSLFTSEP